MLKYSSKGMKHKDRHVLNLFLDTVAIKKILDYTFASEFLETTLFLNLKSSYDANVK